MFLDSQLHRARLEGSPGRFVIERCARAGSDDFEPAGDLLGDAGKIDSRISVQILHPGDEPAESKEELDSEREQENAALAPEAIRFFPDGTADARVIILTDRMGVRSVLKVNPATGRVRPEARPKPK